MAHTKQKELQILASISSRVRRIADANVSPLSFCMDLINGEGPTAIVQALAKLSPAYRDHAIASAYTLQLDPDRRKFLGAYFTPPHLVDHLIGRLETCGFVLDQDRIHDPAAGGAAFIVPLARRIAAKLLKEGADHQHVIGRLHKILSGRELDDGLATLANSLLIRMLSEELGILTPRDMKLVQTGDSLVAKMDPLDVIVGNPPYAKLGKKRQAEWKNAFEDITFGQLNLYAMFMRQAVDNLKPGGLLGFIVPTSFIGSPDYTKFRRRMLELTNVVLLDMIEKRTSVFLDVIQDACFIVFRKRGEGEAAKSEVSCAMLYADGTVDDMGTVLLPQDGAPWKLPSKDLVDGGFTLQDYGYRVRVGHIVSNRQTDLLSSNNSPGTIPLIWAKAITPDGQFDFQRGAGHIGKIWARVNNEASYVIRKSSVIAQRTSNRKQARRINTACVPEDFVDQYGGFVGENHVVVIEPCIESPLIDPNDLSVLLNSEPVNLRFGKMCGTVTVSAQLLSTLDLPDPTLIAGISKIEQGAVDEKVARSYAPTA